MNDALNKAVRAAIIKFSADRFDMSYSYASKSWYAKLYDNRPTQATVSAELRRQGRASDVSVSLAQASKALHEIARRPIATGRGETAEAAVLNLTKAS